VARDESVRALAADLAAFYRRHIEPAQYQAAVARLDLAIEQLDDPLFSGQRTPLCERRLDVERPLMIFVVGVGKAGKSSLINAIAGVDVAPKALLPLTWKIDSYQQHPVARATLRWSNGQETEHAIDEARRLCAEEEAQAKRADAEGRLYTGAVVEARWLLPEIEVPGEVQLVDTPGLHQIRANLRDDPSAERYRPLVQSAPDVLGLAQVYLNKSDAVLWVLDGTQLAGIAGTAVEEMAFYRRDQHAVINKIDVLDGVTPSEIEQNARSMFGDHFGRYFPISAKRARKDPDKWGLSVLQRFLADEFVHQATRKKALATNTLVNVELDAGARVAQSEIERLSDALDKQRAADHHLESRADRLLSGHATNIESAYRDAFAPSRRAMTAHFVKQLPGKDERAARRAFEAHVPRDRCADILAREVRAARRALTAEA
jgi:GTPase SAR1 family protein